MASLPTLLSPSFVFSICLPAARVGCSRDTKSWDAVRGPDYPVTERAVDVQIAGLRKKLGDAGACVKTVRGSRLQVSGVAARCRDGVWYGGYFRAICSLLWLPWPLSRRYTAHVAGPVPFGARQRRAGGSRGRLMSDARPGDVGERRRRGNRRPLSRTGRKGILASYGGSAVRRSRR